MPREAAEGSPWGMTGNVRLYLTGGGINRGGSYTGWGGRHSRMGVGQGRWLALPPVRVDEV